MRTIKYFAVAFNDDGKIGQLFVVRTLGKHASATWTGKIYRNMKAANAGLTRLNCS